MFESPYIKINEHGIDLIKNYQVEKHLDFSEIKQINYLNGHIIKYWGLSLLIGLSIMIFCFRWGVRSAIAYNPLFDTMATRAYIAYHLIIPWLLFVGGVIWAYQALRRSTVIVIDTYEHKYRVALKEFEKTDEIDRLLEFLNERVKLAKHKLINVCINCLHQNTQDYIILI